MPSTNELWNSDSEQDWLMALQRYWSFVKPTHMKIEKEFDSNNVEEIAKLDADKWYEFLREKYFFWKYTAPNRYKTTSNHLKKYLGLGDSLQTLFLIKERIFNFDKENIFVGLTTACEIRGLGTAGASGLLSVLFPFHFATVDQFVVKALLEVEGLPEKSALSKMNPEQLKITDGVILIKILKQKAKELNHEFKSNNWSARKIDMVLWVSSR